jgi:hypothetical protein
VVLCNVLFEKLFVSDVFAHFDIVLETTESYYALKQRIFCVVEALFESKFAYGYANFYAFSARKDLIEALLVTSILFYVFPIFNQINQTDSP